MSDGLRSRPYAIAKDLPITRRTPAELEPGAAEGGWEDGVTAAGRLAPRLTIQLTRKQKTAPSRGT